MMVLHAAGRSDYRASVPDLANLTGYSARSIWRYLTLLKEVGVLSLLYSGGGRGNPATYRLETVPQTVPGSLTETLPSEAETVPDRVTPLSTNSRLLRPKPQVLKASSSEIVNTKTSSIDDSETVPQTVPLGPAGQELLRRIFGEIRTGRKTWDMGRESATLWDEVFTAGGVQACQRLIADVVNYQTDGAQSFDDPFWPRVGVTVKAFGKSALKGYLVALGKGLKNDGLHDYAYAVAKKSAEQVYAEHGNGRKEHLRIVEAR
jgi:hypothetical protein